MSRLHPRLDILPPPQLALWPELGATPDAFTLYGGTALALRLGHRTSIDFDFFAWESFDPSQLLQDVPYLRKARVLQQEANTLTCLLDRDGPVQVSYFGMRRLEIIAPAAAIESPAIRIASLIDLAGTKAAVVQKRAEAKDYLDIHALIRAGVSLPMALTAAGIVYGEQFNSQITLKALSYFDDGNLSDLPRRVQDELAAAARDVDLDRLPQRSELLQAVDHSGERP
ncbi:MAG TPA: nucleotidyl transferase AbiEii/AbiGii toxin family protein [Caulobacteraceae bacterium]|jgi:hypothetical protein